VEKFCLSSCVAGFNVYNPMWGAGGSQNDWKGSWRHTSLDIAGRLPWLLFWTTVRTQEAHQIEYKLAYCREFRLSFSFAGEQRSRMSSSYCSNVVKPPLYSRGGAGNGFRVPRVRDCLRVADGGWALNDQVNAAYRRRSKPCLSLLSSFAAPSHH
jgi:hypothetical protein